jgi:hypothetical protein
VDKSATPPIRRTGRRWSVTGGKSSPWLSSARSRSRRSRMTSSTELAKVALGWPSSAGTARPPGPGRRRSPKSSPPRDGLGPAGAGTAAGDDKAPGSAVGRAGATGRQSGRGSPAGHDAGWVPARRVRPAAGQPRECGSRAGYGGQDRRPTTTATGSPAEGEAASAVVCLVGKSTSWRNAARLTFPLSQNYS